MGSYCWLLPRDRCTTLCSSYEDGMIHYLEYFWYLVFTEMHFYKDSRFLGGWGGSLMLWLISVKGETEEEIAFCSCQWDFLYSFCPCQCYSEQLKPEKEVECASSTSHIARPCPAAAAAAAAGDYVDYRMIRTPPPLPPSLPGFTRTHSGGHWDLKKGLLCPPHPKEKVSFFHWGLNCESLTLPVNDSSAEQRGSSWKGTRMRPPLCLTGSWDIMDLRTLLGLSQCFTFKTLHQLSLIQ